MESTRERIMERLRVMAADEEATGFGAMVAGLYALGFHNQLANALPEDDLEADELLEDFANLVLELRSDDRRGRRPFFTVEQLGELRAELVELTEQVESWGEHPTSPRPDLEGVFTAEELARAAELELERRRGVDTPDTPDALEGIAGAGIPGAAFGDS